MTLEQLKAAADTLTMEERAALASHLLSALDEEPEDDPALVAAEWEAEIERRRIGMESGERPTIPADEVFRKLRERRSSELRP